MSSITTRRQSKRKKLNEDEHKPGLVLDVKRHDRLWFEDGNVIFVASDSGLGFRLHRGVLSLHSNIFKDVFSSPTSSEGDELLEGCPVARLQDRGTDLELLFTLLYDGVKHPFFTGSYPDFDMVCPMLTLSTKYEVPHIREAAVRGLQKLFPSKLSSYDACYQAVDAVGSESLFSTPHLVAAVNMARTHHIPDVLPLALFECATDDLPRLLEPGDCGSLGTQRLSQDDFSRCLKALEKLEKVLLSRISIFLTFEGPHAHPECTSAIHSLVAHLTTISSPILSIAWTFRDIRAELDMALEQLPSEHDSLCEACRDCLLRKYNDSREQLWQELPGMFGLESWSK